MIAIKSLVAAAAMTTLAFATPALAQAGPGAGPVAVACKDDIAKHCAGKEHGAGDVRKCLEAKKAEVSGPCKTALDTTGPGKGMGGMGGMGGMSGQGMGGMGGMGGKQ